MSLVQPARAPAVRFKPVMHLLGGDSLGLVADEPIEFEERAAFGPVANDNETPSPAKWMAGRLERIASAASAQELPHRPILVAAPMAGLSDPDTAMACDAASRPASSWTRPRFTT
jgi:hypothetical protein